MKRTYRNYANWRRKVFQIRFKGYLFVILGLLMATGFNLTFLLDHFGFIRLDRTAHLDAIRQPPSIPWLARLLASDEALHRTQTANPFAMPGAVSQPQQHFLFGSNRQGRDMLSLMVDGSISFALPGLVAVGIAILLGISMGVLDGYIEGIPGWLARRSILIIHSIPRLLLLIIVGILLNFNVYAIMICLGILNIPKISQSISTRIMNLKQQQFIEAAVELGLSKRSIIIEEILWANCKYIIFIQAAFGMADAIFTETTLSYLQLGSNNRSWGWLLAEGVDHITHGQYWTSALPAIGVVVTIMGYYLVGDGLNKISRSRI